MFTWSPSTSSTTLQSIKSLSPSTSSFGRTLLENLTRSPLYHSLTSLDKTKLWSKFYVNDEENVQKVLDAVSVDQKVITNPRANRRRRTVMVTRNDGQPFGFTLQTYLLKRKGEDVPSKVTYVDYVQLDSPAADAGIRAGDVIISINGCVVTGMRHEALVDLIGSCRQMRMIVIFENIRQRIELVARAIKLRKVLNDKLYQLNLIDIEEQKILNRGYLRSISSHKAKHSLANSLSSAGTSSASSVSSAAPSDGSNGISNDAERSIIRIPSVISPATGTYHRYQMRRTVQERRDCHEGFSNKQPVKLLPESGKSRATDTEMGLSAVQRIRCYGSDFKDFDTVSLSSCDVERVSDIPETHSSSQNTAESGAIDNGDNSSKCDATGGNGCDDSGSDLDNDDFDNSVPENATTAATMPPKSGAVFDSVALNHVIRLDDDVVSTNDDDCDYIRILKL